MSADSNLRTTLSVSLLSRWIPESVKAPLKILRVFVSKYGYLKTVRSRACIDVEGRPIPWYTYPAFEYLRQLNFSDKKVFEYGVGNSSLWWQERALSVHGVEDNKEWLERTALLAGPNVSFIHASSSTEYVEAPLAIDTKFDVIVIDGKHHRFECVQVALRKIAQGGLIILDNSDWYPQSSRLLRESGRLQVDMAGFGPIGTHTWVTSLFFDRSFNVAAATERQPWPTIGGHIKDRESHISSQVLEEARMGLDPVSK